MEEGIPTVSFICLHVLETRQEEGKSPSINGYHTRIDRFSWWVSCVTTSNNSGLPPKVKFDIKDKRVGNPVLPRRWRYSFFHHLEDIKLIDLCQFLLNGIRTLGITIKFIHQIGMSGIVWYLNTKLVLVPSLFLLCP